MNKKKQIQAAAAIAAGLLAAPLQAQTIYRCGDTYSQQPCEGARAITPNAHQPTAAERSAAAAAAKRDAALADSMEKDRQRQEALAAKSPQAYIPPPKPQPDFKPHKWPEQAGTRKLDTFTATGPAPKDAAGGDAPKKGKAKGKGKGKKKSAKAAGAPASTEGLMAR